MRNELARMFQRYNLFAYQYVNASMRCESELKVNFRRIITNVKRQLTPIIRTPMDIYLFI